MIKGKPAELIIKADALVTLVSYGAIGYLIMWSVVDDDYYNVAFTLVMGTILGHFVSLYRKSRKNNGGEHEKIGSK